ncbi:Alw26I/Eco31I/Esp3I family type II restriction endonuclease [Sphingomicrobium sp. XHP0235]|uniref:Alw26I/Eco31I/Esp3I family type II restriction endonuclease n=1 Tax=Sphingomicrobium aquimarinum TaxID=3133971 RepID=UPI0031FEFFDE
MSKEVGFRGQPPHEIFHEYMSEIVENAAFEGMPDARYDDGKIQWEAPSNRKGGKFKDTHQKRREWWARKAESVGIDTREDQWISKTAKAIHPTKKKPCKKCGHLMDIRYVYPGANLIKKINALEFVEEEHEAEQTEDIFSLLTRLHDHYGEELVAVLPSIFRQSGAPASSNDFTIWLDWIKAGLVPSEPRGVLSPGAMSNAPDRLDGFHSFNLCCRKTADSGRTKENLRSYNTDRRVFEYWASGNWIAADRLMGIIRRDFRKEKCLNGHPGPCQADHIGPISLGFNHNPYFRLLCGPCNSAKNNRMSFADVDWLRQQEKTGVSVISWHSQELWDECKEQVATDEHALRLSKILRDNRHSLMSALSKIASAGHFSFLASLLELHHADYDVSFRNLRVEGHVTQWDSLERTERATNYAIEQKARRSRVAFGELLAYFEKANRNAFVVSNDVSDAHLHDALSSLNETRDVSAQYNQAILEALSADPEHADGLYRAVQLDFGSFDFSLFNDAQVRLQSHMNELGVQLAGMWDEDRYSREIGD